MTMSIDFIDVPGGRSNRELAFRYIDGSTIVILTYDVTNETVFNDDVMYWASKIHESNAFSYILLANKVDLEDKRKISTDFGMKWAQRLLFTYVECSAKDNFGIDELFSLVVSKCIESYNYTPLVPPRYNQKDEFYDNSFHLQFEDLFEF